MEVLVEPSRLREACERARAGGQGIALVPTMGALHAGHLALIASARERADFVVVSIFVNPTQFAPHEDLDRYPRTLKADCERCAEAGVSLVFAPSVADMYSADEETRVRLDATTRALCGANRVGHFDGVSTIVTKLLNLTGPCLAVFGRKDYQQWRVINRLVNDLFLPVELLGVPTVREADGLALSSRNAYLSSEERARALAIPRALAAAVRAFAAGERRVGVLRAQSETAITAVADSIDYIELATADSVRVLSADEQINGRAVLAVAAHFGSTRLIDNVVLGEDPAPLQEVSDG